MIDNPKDFVQLGVDVCDAKISNTIKTQTAKLIEIIADHIDGCLTYIVRISVDAINFSISG